MRLRPRLTATAWDRLFTPRRGARILNILVDGPLLETKRLGDLRRGFAPRYARQTLQLARRKLWDLVHGPTLPGSNFFRRGGR